MNDLVIIENKIYEIRGQKVMLDFDLAEMYEIETRRRHAFRHPPESQSHRSQHQHHACLRPHAAISSLSCSEARA